MAKIHELILEVEKSLKLLPPEADIWAETMPSPAADARWRNAVNRRDAARDALVKAYEDLEAEIEALKRKRDSMVESIAICTDMMEVREVLYMCGYNHDGSRGDDDDE